MSLPHLERLYIPRSALFGDGAYLIIGDNELIEHTPWVTIMHTPTVVRHGVKCSWLRTYCIAALLDSATHRRARDTWARFGDDRLHLFLQNTHVEHFPDRQPDPSSGRTAGIIP